MRMAGIRRRTLALVVVLLALALLLAWVALRAGPMAPVAVTEARVANIALRPQLFGIGQVAARSTYQIGPTVAGRVLRLAVDVGDSVRAGELLGEMDPVDLQERRRAQEAARARAQAVVREAGARQAFAATQAARYEELGAARATSQESLQAKRQELAVADAALAAAHQELARAGADAAALRAQQGNLRLVAARAGVVIARDAEPGSTVVAGQTVLEVMNPDSLWIALRLDQSAAQGLAPQLPARIVLRSRGGAPLAGRVLRVEPKADAVTEEILAKVVFDAPPVPLPPLGELAEVHLDLPALAQASVIAQAAVRRQGGQTGVWQRSGDGVRWTPVTLGRSSLEGQVQVLSGLSEGDSVIVYSDKPLGARSRVQVAGPGGVGAP